jgi:hypothetical protein
MSTQFLKYLFNFFQHLQFKKIAHHNTFSLKLNFKIGAFVSCNFLTCQKEWGSASYFFFALCVIFLFCFSVSNFLFFFLVRYFLCFFVVSFCSCVNFRLSWFLSNTFAFTFVIIPSFSVF